jgi:type II secretory pathway component PulK
MRAALSPRRPRGSSLVIVLGVLTLLAMVMAVMAQALVTDLRQTRRRANVRYAIELAHSGIDFARATLEAGRGLEEQVLHVAGGDIELRVERREGGHRVTASGRVRLGGAVLEIREEVLEVRVPGG